MSWINYGCGPFNAPPPWINVDVVRTGAIRPQMVVSPDVKEAVARVRESHGPAERVYFGHVLEHIAWDSCVHMLSRIRSELCVPNAEIMVVGPDTFKVLHGWKEGRYEDSLVDETLEYDIQFQQDNPNDTAARHHWNCTEQRVIRLLTLAGFTSPTPVPLDQANDDWPLTSTIDWQCAVHAWT